MNNFEISKRLKRLPPYLFAEIDKTKTQLKNKGVKFIDLSIGDPDIFAPANVCKILFSASKKKENQKYALDQGQLGFRRSISKWSQKRFNITLSETEEILPLIGSKEGLVHFPLGFVNPGDYIIIPSPGYPGYRAAAIFSGAKIYEMPLLARNSFLPDLMSIPVSVRNKARMIYLNYPNNPTTALAPLSFMEKIVKFCVKYGIIIAYDNAYSEVYFKDKPHSILEIKGAKEVAIEFHSLSKTFCMTGFRIGWAVGNHHLIKILLKVKGNIDSGIFAAMQEAGAFVLDTEQQYVCDLRRIFKQRRDFFVAKLKECGFKDVYADSTFYVWAKIPYCFESSSKFTEHLLMKKNIVATPGVGFGKYGEGFVRFALTVDKKILEKVFKNKLY